MGRFASHFARKGVVTCKYNMPTPRAVRTDLPPVGVMKIHTCLTPAGRKYFFKMVRLRKFTFSQRFFSFPRV